MIAISLTSPLFVAVGSTFTIPTALLADFYIHDKTLPPLSYVGVGLVLFGFACLNLSELFCVTRKSISYNSLDDDEDDDDLNPQLIGDFEDGSVIKQLAAFPPVVLEQSCTAT